MRLFLLPALLFILCGCRAFEPSPDVHLSSTQALDIAERAASKQNIDFKNYHQPEIIFYSPAVAPPDGTWDIFWSPNLDSDEAFVVNINDRTGRITFAKQVINPPKGTMAPLPNPAPEP